MPVSIKGTGGGSVTLTAGAAAADTTLTIPNVTGTVLQSGTAVTVAQGGTGATTLTANNVLLGNGTSALQVVAPGTSGNVLTSNGTAWVSSAPAVSGQVLNRIINGNMAVDQRNAGAAQTITAAAALAYTVDRFYAYCTGANVTGQQVAGATANQYRYRFTGAASVTAIGFAQRIEALNSADLAGTTATLSVDLANSVLTTVTWTAYYANTTDTFGTLASPTVTSIATGTFTVTSTVTRYNAQISIPSAATTGLQILLTVGAQTSGTWTIGNVQLESGSSASAYSSQIYSTQLSQCQRYYQINSGDVIVANISSYESKPFVATMRTSPTVTISISGGSFSQPLVSNQYSYRFQYSATTGYSYTSSAEL